MKWRNGIMILIVIISMCFSIAYADKTVVTKGRTDQGYIRLKSTTNSDGVTTTKGTINGKYVRTKTRNGVTKGTVNGKYVTVKTKTRDW